jgi:hypothetical protein
MHSPFYYSQNNSTLDPTQSQMNAVHTIIFFFSVAPQHKSGLDFHMAKVSRSHTVTHTHTHTHINPKRFLCTNDQLDTQAATHTTHNKHNRRTSMPSTGFDPTVSGIKRQNTRALDRTTHLNRPVILYSISN